MSLITSSIILHLIWDSTNDGSSADKEKQEIFVRNNEKGPPKRQPMNLFFKTTV